VEVNTAPVLTATNNSPQCQGGALFFNINTVSGATYSWSGPNGYTSSNQSPGISNAQPSASGTYVVQVNTPACGVISATTVVSVGSSLVGVNVLSNSPVCVGGNILLSAMQRPGFTYNWSGPSGFTSTDAQPVTLTNVTTANQGSYSVIFASAGCGTTSRSVSVRVNNPALVSASSTSPVCVNGVIYFTGVAPNGSTFSWSGPGAFASTLRSPSRINAQLGHAGAYTLSANVPGCGIVTTTTTVTVQNCRQSDAETPKDQVYGQSNTLDESELLAGGQSAVTTSISDLKLTVWPNPANGNWVNVKWDGLVGKDRDISVKVYDATGKTVFVKSISRPLHNQEVVEDTLQFAMPLAKGMYTIETIFEGSRVYEKMIVE
jgi:hypothetical protein